MFVFHSSFLRAGPCHERYRETPQPVVASAPCLAQLPLTREGLFWLVIAVALLVVGLVKTINLITLFASLLIVLVVWNWWTARRQVHAVDAVPYDDGLPFAATPFRASVRLHNRGRRSVSGLEVRTGPGPLQPRWFVPELAAGATQVLETEIIYPRRGRVEAEALTVVSGYPLGLVRVEQRAGAAIDRIVLPRLGTLHRARLQRFLSRQSPNLGQARSVPSPSPLAQSEFHGLRPIGPATARARSIGGRAPAAAS